MIHLAHDTVTQKQFIPTHKVPAFGHPFPPTRYFFWIYVSFSRIQETDICKFILYMFYILPLLTGWCILPKRSMVLLMPPLHHSLRLKTSWQSNLFLYKRSFSKSNRNQSSERESL